MHEPGEFDLSACEREPIHIPGSIQPHGILLSIDESGRIVAASDNAAQKWGPVVGRPIAELIGEDALSRAVAAENANASYAGQIEHGSEAFDVFAHRTHQGRIIELEAATHKRPSAVETLEQMVSNSLRMSEAANLTAASQVAAEAVRRVTGYDRVMIYRFLDDDSGEVIAEARRADIAPLLNHRYPASDIPRQARALYLTNPIRVIPEVGYTPVALRSEGEPVDLSGALFRSVSPVHIEYLKNMGVGASASVSIVQDGQLWGLIACHHMSGRPIGHERREMARQIALSLEAAIHRLEEEQTQREALRLTRKREELLPKVAAEENLREGLVRNIGELLNLVPAHGLALVLDGEIATAGNTPPDAAISELGEWVMGLAAPAIYATDRLSREYKPAEALTAHASGLLALIVSRKPAIAALWFRAEQVETVNWAGTPP